MKERERELGFWNLQNVEGVTLFTHIDIVPGN